MNKLNKTLTSVLAAQIALVAVVWTSRDAASISDPEPIVAGFEPGEVVRLEVFDRRARDDEDDSEPAVVLARGADGFVVDSAHGYPADASRVDELLSSIEGMSSREPIASGDGRARQLEVAADHYDRKLVIHVDGGESKTVYLGAPAGRGRIAARVDGDAAIHAVEATVGRAARVRASDWAEQPYFEVERDDIAALSIESDQLSAAFVRDEDGAWSLDEEASAVKAPAGQVLDPDAVDTIARAVSRLRLAAVAGGEPAPDHGLEEPRARVEIALKGGEATEGEARDGDTGLSVAHERFTLSFGAEDDGRVYVTEADKRFVVLVSESAIKAVLDAEAEGLFTTEEELEEDEPEHNPPPLDLPGAGDLGAGAPPAP